MAPTAMRLRLGCVALLATAPLTCTTARRGPAAHAAPTPAAVAPAAAPVVRAPPSERPEGFDLGAPDVLERDVDGDRLADRVRVIPRVERPSAAPLTFGDLPPALVAHGLADGRYALDDDLTRAALRALCPDAPPARFTPDASPIEADDDGERDRRAKTLYLDALCARAWGRSPDDVAAALRATLSDAGAAAVPAALIEAMVRALAPLRFAFALRPMEVAFPSTGPAGRADADAGATAAAPADAAALDPACRAAVAADARLRASARRAGARIAAGPNPPERTVPDWTPPELPDEPRCLAGPAGTWSLRFVSLDDAADDDGLVGPVRLTFAPASGPGRYAPAPMPRPWSQGVFATRTYALDRTFDWDHDGRPEVVVRTDTWEHEGASESVRTIFSARDGAVVEYGPAAGLNGRILGVEDADGDGRGDLLLPTAWRFVDGCGMAGIAHEGPGLLAHALPDGGFSTRDAVARAWVTRACEHLSSPGEFAHSPGDRDVWRVACARVWGASPEHIVAALRADHRGRPRLQPGHNDQEVCYPFQDLASLALVAPPFALP
ncbi:MAG: VCBS repeat-containing protein [Myxococcales bacterium]|nr:VCBS repeat-containing protein [Myxococcales bacterium]